ncbi:MAG: hypothetical protein JWM21_4336 [Acidobacteria bacterium]|nr:hypothetical protein [Acidobacteriota bacterium]
MRTLKLLSVTMALVGLTACYGTRSSEQRAVAPASNSAAGKDTDSVATNALEKQGSAKPNFALNQRVSLQQADQTQTMTEAMNRKIIQDAEVALEVDSPLETQRSVTSIAESHGGFVVTSEAKQRQSEDPSQRLMDVTLMIRVPSSQFGPTRDAILGLSKRVLDNKNTGQDVTEEFIDLEARAKTQKALEAQFLEIMKQAHKVEDALEVQRQIADVRTEIEKLEGRKRFLENRSSLSTITVNLKSPTTIVVTPTGFGRDVKEAMKESVEIARSIVLFLIRFVIVMVPIFLFVFLPLALLARYLMRRARRQRTVIGANVEPPTPVPAA